MGYRINTDEEWNTTLSEQDIIENNCKVYFAMVGLYLRTIQHKIEGFSYNPSSIYKVDLPGTWKVVSVV